MNKIRSGYVYPWRYIPNWIRNFKEFFHYIKRRFQRGRYGICHYDAWDLDYYLLNVFENGIKVLREKTCGYPMQVTEDEWNNILTRMEELVIVLKTEDINNPEIDKYYDEDIDVWFEKIKEWDEYQRDCLDELCDLMKEWFFHLWW